MTERELLKKRVENIKKMSASAKKVSEEIKAAKEARSIPNTTDIPYLS